MIVSEMIRWRFLMRFVNQGHSQQIDMDESIFKDSQALHLMAQQYLNVKLYTRKDSFYDDFGVFSIENGIVSFQVPDIKMDIYQDNSPNKDTVDTPIAPKENQSSQPSKQQPEMTQDIGRKNRSKSPPKRDFRKNITKNVVQNSCRTFQKDVLAQKVIKDKCKKMKLPYEHFLQLIQQILSEYHISNKILLTRYLKPQQKDPKFTAKLLFAEYFEFYLENSLVEVYEQASQVKNREAYISYARTYLAYLGTHSGSQEISNQNNRI